MSGGRGGAPSRRGRSEDHPPRSSWGILTLRVVGSSAISTYSPTPGVGADASILIVTGPSASSVEFVSVVKRYPGQADPAIDKLSLKVPAGEICVLVGPSGCGKTTAL